jgi:endonuclease-3
MSLTIAAVLAGLKVRHPDARYELDWETPTQLLAATILAAQCTDARVNAVTKDLFKKYPDAQAFADADTEELEQAIKSTGTYKNKAKSIQGACRALVKSFGGEVPKTMAEMLTLPGVQRKSANVVLNTAYKLPSGIIVDTHVARIAPRMGLTKQTKPEAIEQDLMKKVDESEWVFFGPAMVLHGRYTCTSKAPKCSECPFHATCPKVGVTEGAKGESDDE